ncbi:MAG: GNAT family N-acetyltransferase [Lachnospiraceae bacterium]|nr:GNAT family N-acetyltransferase [Lachnospiraceae bacterium]
MNIENITFTHSISVENYNALRTSVDFIPIRPKRAEIALTNSLYILVAMKGDTPIGMARVVGDGGYVYFVCDVIVRPEYQSQGLGRQIIETVLAWLENQVEEGETIMVNLMSAMNKESFYEKLGFHKRPFGNHGSGMSRWISGGPD